MAHESTHMTMTESRPKRFGEGIGRVHNTWNVFQNNFAIRLPFLNRKVLNVDMPRSRRRALGVDHEDGGRIVFIQCGRIQLWVAQVQEDGA